MRFEFATSNRIIFGPGTIKEVAPLAAELGRKIFVIVGRTTERAAQLMEHLARQGIEPVTYAVPGEPTTDLVLDGVKLARKARSTVVIGLGGGSVLDTGKVVAALLTNTGDLSDYLEVVGRGRPLCNPPTPYIAIPTTAGSGAEVTRNAVLSVPEHRVKVSIRSPLILPRLAVIDPLLTHSMPPDLTASTGLDALTQLMEPFVSKQASPLTDAVCREGLGRAARSLRACYEDGTNETAREDMSIASLFGGLALANAKLGAVHGLAAPLGGLLGAPHGAICARLLPYVMEVNVRVLGSRTTQGPELMRYHEMARILARTTTARANDGVAWVQDLCAALRVPRLSTYGLRESQLPHILKEAQRASSMKGNPAALTDEDVMEILRKAL